MRKNLLTPSEELGSFYRRCRESRVNDDNVEQTLSRRFVNAHGWDIGERHWNATLA
jgi:hypothetical protein